MKLGDLFDEVRFGKDFVDSKSSVTALKESIDEDYNIIKVSERVSNLLKDCDTTQLFNKKISRAARNYRDYENKVFEGTDVSGIYKKMKSDSVVSMINEAINIIEKDRKSFRGDNTANIAKAISILQYGSATILEGTSYTRKTIVAIKDPILQNNVKKETELIETIL